MILRSRSASRSLWRKQDFSILVRIPEASQKVSRITLKSIHSSKEPRPNIITSSTNSRCVRNSCGKIFIPLILPFLLASLIRRLILSITRMNNRGDSGQPCLIPRKARKKVVGDPFTRTTKLAEEIHPRIQFIPTRGTPIWISKRRMKVQLTLSKAFVKSNLRMSAHLFFVLTE